MFERPFAFDGRIRRLEYGLSVVFRVLTFLIALGITAAVPKVGLSIYLISLVPIFWFTIAQASKRSHDVGNSGWFQLIPLYGFVLLFVDSDHGINKYGLNPKGIGNKVTAQPSDDIIPAQQD